MTDSASPVANPPAALSVEGLRFRHAGSTGGAWTIDLPALELAHGEQVLLEGGSGTGKSTLLLLIAGLLDPDAGRVRVGGTDVHRLRGSRRDRFRGAHLGMIFQTFHLLEGFTAVENVLAALMFSELPPAEHRHRATSLLGSLGIDRPDARPDQLSVGQQQRVAVARALACRPVLVLADEPTASLDPANAAASMNLIQEACRENGAALLCTSHDPSMKERFRRVLELTKP
ncbi:MAG: ATP-binding cassette domain-containing protein [Phycisphaerales bacterium]|nr:ATP-binding cassette domain-containing protein [Phycisphaerales bacterium]